MNSVDDLPPSLLMFHREHARYTRLSRGSNGNRAVLAQYRPASSTACTYVASEISRPPGVARSLRSRSATIPLEVRVTKWDVRVVLFHQRIGYRCPLVLLRQCRSASCPAYQGQPAAPKLTEGQERPGASVQHLQYALASPRCLWCMSWPIWWVALCRMNRIQSIDPVVT